MPDAEGRYRVAIVGSTDLFPDDEMFAALNRMRDRHPEGVTVVVKDGPGVAVVGWQTAAMIGIPHTIVARPERDPDASAAEAGTAYNAVLLDEADALLAFFHPGQNIALTSSGTMNAINQAKGRSMPIFVYHEGRWGTGGLPEKRRGRRA